MQHNARITGRVNDPNLIILKVELPEWTNFLLVGNRNVETAVDTAGHAGTVAGQCGTNEQRTAGDRHFRITRNVACCVPAGIIIAAEIGQ